MDEAPPIIPRHEPDDMVLQIERLRDMAADAGLGTLAHALEIAMLEARRVSDEARLAEAERSADPRDLWRPG